MTGASCKEREQAASSLVVYMTGCGYTACVIPRGYVKRLWACKKPTKMIKMLQAYKLVDALLKRRIGTFA
jgi:hypothetical protein